MTHISNKIDEIEVVTEINDIDVAIIAESWLDNTLAMARVLKYTLRIDER